MSRISSRLISPFINRLSSFLHHSLVWGIELFFFSHAQKRGSTSHCMWRQLVTTSMATKMKEKATDHWVEKTASRQVFSCAAQRSNWGDNCRLLWPSKAAGLAFSSQRVFNHGEKNERDLDTYSAFFKASSRQSLLYQDSLFFKAKVTYYNWSQRPSRLKAMIVWRSSVTYGNWLKFQWLILACPLNSIPQ